MTKKYSLKLIITLVVLLLSIVPFSCDPYDCAGNSYNYRIDNYSFIAGKIYREGAGNSYFEASDFVHISDFAIQMKADSIIRVAAASQQSGFSLINSAMACSPAIDLDNLVSKLSVTATDTLWFYQEAYPSGKDLSEFFEGVQYFSGQRFSEGNDEIVLRFDVVPNKKFTTAFLFEITFREGGGYVTKTASTESVQVYY